MLISIDRYDVIYHTPEDDAKFESLMKAQNLWSNNAVNEAKWTFGIKADLAFLVQEEDIYTAFERCQSRLVEGTSPEPFLTID